MRRRIIDFFRKSFSDMTASARAQRKADKADFEAVRAESRAAWEEAKAMRRVDFRKEREQAVRDERIASSKVRIADAEARIKSAHNRK